MSANLSEHAGDGKIENLEAHRPILLAQPGSPGDGDWPPARTYWDGYQEGRESGERHGRNMAEIEGRFAADEAERRGYERGRQDGIDECGWPVLLRQVGSFLGGLFWIAVFGGVWVVILADTFNDGKKAGLAEARQTVNIEKKADAR